MSDTAPTGHYPIERRKGEIERLEFQHAAFAGDAERMLDLIGVRDGWHCVDLGCGPGTMLGLLSARAGASGRVIGVDSDPAFIEYAQRRSRVRRLSNVEVAVDDGYRSKLPPNTFDLVHSRFVASTAGRPEDLLRESIRLARPGGTIAFQEPDFHTLRCFPPNAEWQRLAELLEQAFSSVGSDVRLGARLFALMRHAGLADVRFRPFMVGFRSSEPMSDYVPACIESVRHALVDHGVATGAEIDRLLAAARTHLRDPGTVTTSITVVQAWGTKS